MSEALTGTLIAAVAALVGSLLAALVTILAARRQAQAAWSAGQRQADAAWEAGRRQADAAWEAGRIQAQAQLDIARRTLQEQALTIQRAVRRAAYVTLLADADAARDAELSWQAALGSAEAGTLGQERDTAAATLRGSLNVVRLEGPQEAVSAAEALFVALNDSGDGSHYSAAHTAFLSAARQALSPPEAG